MNNIIAAWLLLITLNVFADDVILVSQTFKGVTRGDLVTFKVLDQRDIVYFKKYEKKRIGPLLYVIKVKTKDNSIFFETIISEIAPKEKKVEIDDVFKIVELNYYPTKSKPLMDFITFDIPITIEKNRQYLYMIILGLILLFVVFYYMKSKKTRKLQKLEKEKQKKIVEKYKQMVSSASTEENFAIIYSNRKTITKHFSFDTSSFKQCMKILEQIQYQQTWPEEGFSEVKVLFEKVKNTIKVKDGV